jgi:chemotaxis protein methyltransferase CheR
MHLSHATFDELARLIHDLTGLVVGREKSYLVKHRLESVAREFGCDSFESFLIQLKAISGARLKEAVIEAITTKETSFFRDPWFFDALREHILPRCARVLDSGHRHRVRIWSAAASAGQEAYSLAMLTRELQDHPELGPRFRQFSILASDISTHALQAARLGRYSPRETARGISPERLARHFFRAGDLWQVHPHLQQLVTFRRIDLLRLPADIGPFDLILCRNILFYFDQPTCERLCNALFALLEPGGFLALGAAESLYGIDDRFEMIRHGRAIIYRRPPPK